MHLLVPGPASRKDLQDLEGGATPVLIISEQSDDHGEASQDHHHRDQGEDGCTEPLHQRRQKGSRHGSSSEDYVPDASSPTLASGPASGDLLSSQATAVRLGMLA